MAIRKYKIQYTSKGVQYVEVPVTQTAFKIKPAKLSPRDTSGVQVKQSSRQSSLPVPVKQYGRTELAVQECIKNGIKDEYAIAEAIRIAYEGSERGENYIDKAIKRGIGYWKKIK